jgi:ribosomal protein L35
MKLKTKSAARKRFKLTANGKAIRRPVKQSHFNALASGNETRRKHGDAGISDSDTHRLDDLLSK